jgi:hypothetical protein
MPLKRPGIGYPSNRRTYMPKTSQPSPSPIEADFAELEAKLKVQNPGVYDVLLAYGPYDAAAKLA